MKILHITVNDKIATYSQREGYIVCGNSDYMIEFTFDAEWEEHQFKTARFITPAGVQDVLFEGNAVEVPVLRDTFLVTVGVYAGDLQTTTPANIPCRKSILCQDGLPPDPEPNLYTQIMTKLGMGAVSIDLSAYDQEGKIVETYANGTTRTTTLEFDELGNPVKITDSDGNVTVLQW